MSQRQRIPVSHILYSPATLVEMIPWQKWSSDGHFRKKLTFFLADSSGNSLSSAELRISAPNPALSYQSSSEPRRLMAQPLYILCM
jgi:hypothetical protein